MMIPPEKRPNESYSGSPDDSSDQPPNESMDTLKRLIARRASMGRVGIFGSTPALASSTDAKFKLHSLANGVDPESISMQKREADDSQSKILNHALKLESLEAEFSDLISTGKTVPEIRFLISNIELGVSTLGRQALECKVIVRVSRDLDRASESPAHKGIAHSYVMRAARPNPRTNSRQASAPHRRRRTASPTRPHSRNTTDQLRRRPRRRRSHPTPPPR